MTSSPLEPTQGSQQATVTHAVSGDSDDAPTEARNVGSSHRTAEAVWDDEVRFRVLREHARGGLGQIFVARDQQLGRDVALKEIQPALADDIASQNRFLLEAEVTGNLEHPGFVPVYALGRYPDGRPYYAMRLIRGESLKQAIAGLHQHAGGVKQKIARRELRALLQRLVDVCNAMAYAHSRGVIHRDLKPANILLGPYGETVVVDWGLAKVMSHRDDRPASVPVAPAEDLASSPLIDSTASFATTQPLLHDSRPMDQSSLATTASNETTSATSDFTLSTQPPPPRFVHTRLFHVGDTLVQDDSPGAWVPSSGSGEGHTLPGRAVGTPAYMSPEQAAGALERIGPASDIYSLGATLYCVLTGHAPFGESGDLLETLARVQEGAFAPPGAVAQGIPRPLDAICLKAMARRPEDRYASMTALADDLESYLADEPVVAYREHWPSRLARWSRRHKSWAGATAVTMLAILTVMGLTTEGFRRSAARERAAREHGLRVAAKFAARTVGAEIDRRWRILEDEADDPALIALIKAARGQPFQSQPRQALQQSLARRFAVHQRIASASNWFLTDEHGIQIARAPLIERSIGANYSFRDYFHGQGLDLPEGTRNIAPTTHPHRSIVFQSRNTGRHIVVFSVPIFDLPYDPEAPVQNHAPSKILGVLGMAVDVGRFGVLQLDVGDEQIAVLADLRNDDTGRRGLILHHPGLTMSESEQGMAYLSPHRLLTAGRLREAALVRYRARGHAGDTLSSPRQRSQPLPDSFANDYHDPVGGAYAGRWLAAFEPVVIEGRPDMIDDTGWMVIVQERDTHGL